jgi:hypothetical protein
VPTFQDYNRAIQQYTLQKQAADPEWQAWQQQVAGLPLDLQGSIASPEKDYAAEYLQSLSPEQQAEFWQSYQAAREEDKKSFKGRFGQAMSLIPAVVGAAGLAGAAGLLGPGAGFPGTSIFSSGAGLGTGLGATSFPVAPGAVETTALGSGAISSGSGFMGAGVPGAAAAGAPAATGGGLYSLAGASAIPAATSLAGAGLSAAAPAVAPGLLAGLGSVGSALKDYGPALAAGAGLVNSAVGGPALPAAPDYAALLKQQTDAQNALYDKQISDARVNQIGPDGSQTWAKGPDGRWTLSTSLNPTQQGLYDQQQNISGDLLGSADNALSQPLSMAGVPGMNYGTVDSNGMPNYNQTVADAYYRQGTRYLDPQIAQDQTSLESRLGQQGFVPGTPAYNQAMQNFMDTKNRAYGSARDFATTQGFTTGLETAKFGNQARGQTLAEMLALRNQPLNELNAFRTGSQVSTPQWNAQYSTPQQQAPDVVGTATQGYNAGLGQYNAGVAQNQATTNNLFGLAGTMLNGKYNLFTGMGTKP